MDSTISIIAIEGYPHFSLRNVAKHVGFGLGVIQHFFPTKSELLKAALARECQRYEDEMDEIAQNLNTVAETKFKKLVSVHYSASMDPLTAGFFVSFWALSNHDKEALVLQNALYDNAVKRMTGVIAELNPTLTKSDCLNRAILIITTLEGAVILCGPDKIFNSKKNIAKKVFLDNLLKICTSN